MVRPNVRRIPEILVGGCLMSMLSFGPLYKDRLLSINHRPIMSYFQLTMYLLSINDGLLWGMAAYNYRLF